MQRQKAFVFMNVEMGKEKELIEKISAIEGITETCMIYGVYDLVAVADVKEVADIRTTVIEKIRKIDGIQSTMTLLVAIPLPA